MAYEFRTASRHLSEKDVENYAFILRQSQNTTGHHACQVPTRPAALNATVNETMSLTNAILSAGFLLPASYPRITFTIWWRLCCRIGPACLTVTPALCCSATENAHYPATCMLLTGFPLCSVTDESSLLANTSIYAQRNLFMYCSFKEVCAYRLAHAMPTSQHLSKLLPPTSGHCMSCATFVPVPCESLYAKYSMTWSRLALSRPILPPDRCLTSLSNSSASTPLRFVLAFAAFACAN